MSNKIVRRLLCGVGLTLLSASAALGQTSGQTAQGTATPAPAAETRPATTTFRGDTGLWFVPTGEILPARQWSFSVYRVNNDFEQGFTDVSNFPVTFGVGLADRAEVFGAWDVVRRIDRDVRPLFFPAAPGSTLEQGGVVNEYPFVNDQWSGSQLGDFWVGAKVNITSEHRQAPAAFAVRGMLKLPTASTDDGVGTGEVDFAFDGIVSKELNQRVELSGFAGYIFRGDPDEYDLQNGFRWGVGAGFPTRRSLRFTAELHGEFYAGDTVESRAVDQLSFFSENDGPVNASLGLTWISSRGMFVGAGLNWNLALSGREDFGSFENEGGDALGFQFRIGYHPGVRVYVPPPPPPPPPAPPAKPDNRPPTVVARCEPCTVEVGRTSTITADASDPDGDTLSYKWSCPAGTVARPTDRQTPWTAPNQPGPVQCTVTVSDGKGGTASANVTIQVIQPAVREITFEDVHFDFDRYSLRPEATRALDEAIKAMQENADLRIEIEGHTCNIGTSEYNLALGERRANAVREYLTSRGIAVSRLNAVSYGEERPKHDNAREETRRLNRRAALVVRLQR